MAGLPFKVCEFNVENLFLSMEFYRGQDLNLMTELQWKEVALGQLRQKQKSLAKLHGLAKAILDINPNILMLVEVGGRDSLENFSRYFLSEKFVPYFIEGNSKRNIDLGFLVRRDLPFEVEIRSNRETPIEVHSYQGKYTGRFSRDIGELRLSAGADLKLILLLTHLKSKISSDQDRSGKDVRTAEGVALASKYENLRVAHPNVPILVSGDFNTSLESLELELLSRTDLVDFHVLLGTAPESRHSYVYFDFVDQAHPSTLDYILISPHLRDKIIPSQCYTYRYKGFYDIPEILPRNSRERYQMPSDHYPVVLTFCLD